MSSSIQHGDGFEKNDLPVDEDEVQEVPNVDLDEENVSLLLYIVLVVY